MVKVSISHHHIWNPACLVVDIIKEYQEQGQVCIDLNAEGPCADSIGLYQILDNICERFDFDKKRITILTCNFEEMHEEYIIERQPQHWIHSSVQAFKQLNFFADDKDVTKNLFGCIYNKPSWDRLCILSYIHANTDSLSLLCCNGIWQGACVNSLYLDNLVDYFPEMFFPVTDFLKTCPTNAAGDTLKLTPNIEQAMALAWRYNEFFIDIVGETHSQGRSFFITEKTLRPMLAMTPVILQAPKSFLSTLKSDYGVRSFDRWWNEDYDNYDGSERLKRIFKIIDVIDSWTLGDRQHVYREMQPTLRHNQALWLNHLQAK